MSIFNDLNNFQLNKLIFLKEKKYSTSTKNSYWALYSNYISNIEIEQKKDLYDLSQNDINIIKNTIKDKKIQTIRSLYSFIKGYMVWYSEYYKKPKKTFILKQEKSNNGSWYIHKEDFFEICKEMLDANVSISNITPLVFARYGIVGKEAIYMRNARWSDIDFKNKGITIYSKGRQKELCFIPVDNNFLEWITILKNYEDEGMTNEYIIKSQIDVDNIINYNSLNTKNYLCFKSIEMKRISFRTLCDCAIVDYIDAVYSNKPLYANDELRLYLKPYFPEESLSKIRVCIIKNKYTEVTGNFKNMTVRTGIKNMSIIKKQLDNKDNFRKNDEKFLEDIKIARDSVSNKLIKFSEENIAKIIINLNNKEYEAFIDFDDVNKVKKHKWKINLSGAVITSIKKKEGLKIIHLSNYILGVSEYYKIKYKNGNKLDCRKENLEIVEEYAL
jgi:hypothetical protein